MAFSGTKQMLLGRVLLWLLLVLAIFLLIEQSGWSGRWKQDADGSWRRGWNLQEKPAPDAG
jgi:hypothetical protein